MSDPAAGPALGPEYFARQDEAPDDEFYREPRLVTHIDDAAIAALTAFYGDVIPDGAFVLDLMTSWVSHLPPAKPLAGVAGLGMNAVELGHNPALTEWVVQDLNRDPHLPWEDARFDAAVVTVSVQYLTSPVDVFAEVGKGPQARGPVRRRLLEPLLSDQGGRGLALTEQPRPRRPDRALHPAPRALHHAAGLRPQPRPRPGPAVRGCCPPAR